MLEIDGSHGEGGGQILRTAVAMSSVYDKDVKIYNIRANRPDPGLSHQHLMALKAASEITDAETSGLEKGSETVEFRPSNLKGGEYRFDIGTAGSVTLLMQALLPPILKGDEKISVKAKGGTDVKWSPPYDYFDNVLLVNLRDMGAEVESELIKRGHYPQGGGEIRVEVEPSELGGIYRSQEIGEIRGLAYVTDLPDHIVDRMKRSALKELIDYDVSIEKSSYSSRSAGTGITLWTTGERKLGCGVLGEKGVPAEKVGKEAGEELMDYIESGADIDRWAADQLVPFLAITEDAGQVSIREKTSHLETNIWVVNQFQNDEIELIESKNGYLMKY